MFVGSSYIEGIQKEVTKLTIATSREESLAPKLTALKTMLPLNIKI